VGEDRRSSVGEGRKVGLEHESRTSEKPAFLIRSERGGVNDLEGAQGGFRATGPRICWRLTITTAQISRGHWGSYGLDSGQVWALVIVSLLGVGGHWRICGTLPLISHLTVCRGGVRGGRGCWGMPCALVCRVRAVICLYLHAINHCDTSECPWAMTSSSRA
jgi:hypothetical protein